MWMFKNCIVLVLFFVYSGNNGINARALIAKSTNITKIPSAPLRPSNVQSSSKVPHADWDLDLLKNLNKYETNILHRFIGMIGRLIPKRFKYLGQEPGFLPNLNINMLGLQAGLHNGKLYKYSKYYAKKDISKLKLGTYDISNRLYWPEVILNGTYYIQSSMGKTNLSNHDKFEIKITNLTVTSEWCWQLLPIRIRILDVTMHVENVRLNLGNLFHSRFVSAVFNGIASEEVKTVLNQSFELLSLPVKIGIKGTFNGFFNMLEKMMSNMPGARYINKVI